MMINLSGETCWGSFFLENQNSISKKIRVATFQGNFCGIFSFNLKVVSTTNSNCGASNLRESMRNHDTKNPTSANRQGLGLVES